MTEPSGAPREIDMSNSSGKAPVQAQPSTENLINPKDCPKTAMHPLFRILRIFLIGSFALAMLALCLYALVAWSIGGAFFSIFSAVAKGGVEGGTFQPVKKDGADDDPKDPKDGSPSQRTPSRVSVQDPKDAKDPKLSLQKPT